MEAIVITPNLVWQDNEESAKRIPQKWMNEIPRLYIAKNRALDVGTMWNNWLHIQEEIQKCFADPTTVTIQAEGLKRWERHFDFAAYFAAIGVQIGPNTTISVAQEAFDKFAELLDDGAKSEFAGEALVYMIFLENQHGMRRRYVTEDTIRECHQFVTEEAMPLWTVSFYRRHILQNPDFDNEKAIVENMRAAFKETLNEDDWLEPATREKILSMLEKLDFYLGVFYEAYSEEKLMAHYNKRLPMDATNFFDWKSRFYQDVAGKELLSDSRYKLQLAVDAYSRKLYAWIPLGYLGFHSDDYALEYQYAQLGFTIGHEMTHTFDTNIEWKGNGTVFTGNDRDEFDEKTHCIVDQFKNITHAGESGETVTEAGETSIPETMSDNMAVRTSFRAFRKELNRRYGREGDAFRLPGLEQYTTDQLFFLSLANQIHPPHKSRISTAMKNSAEFAKAFKCKKNAPMNPEKKCRVWRYKKH
ncbi:unnamed protein product, partial [Mesorhabditis spiculigera]